MKCACVTGRLCARSRPLATASPKPRTRHRHRRRPRPAPARRCLPGPLGTSSASARRPQHAAAAASAAAAAAVRRGPCAPAGRRGRAAAPLLRPGRRGLCLQMVDAGGRPAAEGWRRMEAPPDSADLVPLDRYDAARAKIAANLQWICAKAYGLGGRGRRGSGTGDGDPPGDGWSLGLGQGRTGTGLGTRPGDATRQGRSPGRGQGAPSRGVRRLPSAPALAAAPASAALRSLAVGAGAGLCVRVSAKLRVSPGGGGWPPGAGCSVRPGVSLRSLGRSSGSECKKGPSYLDSHCPDRLPHGGSCKT